MPSVRSVSNIKANLLRPATTSHFEVEIPIINALSKWRGIGKQDKIELMCSEASLPGSNLATFEINNDRTGVTEKHVHRRIFDDRIDLTFYVDAGLYSPIRFFEDWMALITNGTFNEDSINSRNVTEAMESELIDKSYNYRLRYPDDYIKDQGLIVRKFEREKTFGNLLEYEFVRVFPLAISSMPVSYDTSSLLKCTVSMSYIRYIVKSIPTPTIKVPMERNPDPIQQAQQNSVNILPGQADLAMPQPVLQMPPYITPSAPPGFPRPETIA